MLKGHVFSKQLFGNPIFALFINTFLNGTNGVSNNYKNGMKVTYSGSTVTIQSGAVCVQGRFLEEDTSSSISAGTDTAFCKLVIEIDLDKTNTESEFNQGAYKIVKGTSNYPSLTQNNIVKNNSGKYQYELARFKTGTSGITNFQDMRTFLDFNSIYNLITTEYRSILTQLQQELSDVKDGSAYILNEVEEETIQGGYEGQTLYYKYSAVFKKIGKILNVKVTVTTNEFSCSNKFSIPDFAKPNQANEEMLASAVAMFLGKSEAKCIFYISNKNDGNAELSFIVDAEGGSTDTGEKVFTANMTYIIE